MKNLIVFAAIVALLSAGCSSKQITYDPMGRKTITTKTNEDIFHEQQANAWGGYYEALKNPPVIATIQQVDGTVLTINSQIPPPAPVIRQHQNQYIGPVADLIKFGIGGTVAYGITRSIVRGAGDISVNNSGDGTVITDRSDNIASKSNTDLQTNTDRSDNSDNSDNSLNDAFNQTADPTVVTQPDPTIVEQPPYNDPIVVTQPDPVIVEQPPYNDPVVVDPPEYNDPIVVDPPPYNDPVIIPAPDPVIVPAPDPIIITQPDPVFVPTPVESTSME